MKKWFAIIVTTLFIIGGMTTFNSAADENAMTYVEFAELLVNSIGIELPAGTEDLSDAEYLEVVANVLASRGVGYLLDKNPGDTITAGNMVELLYAMLGGTENWNVDEIMQFLIDNGYITPINPNSPITLAYASDVLNNPAFADTVAEAFGAGEGEGGGEGDVDALAAVPEDLNPGTTPPGTPALTSVSPNGSEID